MYKISEVSKITGIPIDSIRYYVKQGLIHPIQKGTYSYYDTWSINYLLDYKKYHELGFSLKEIKSMFDNDDSGIMIDRFRKIQDIYDYKAKYYTYLSAKNREFTNQIESISKDINRYTETWMPEYVCLKHRQHHVYDGVPDDLTSLYYQLYSFAEGIVIFDKKNILSESPEDDYTWYWGIKKEYFTPFAEIDDRLFITERRKALYTVIIVHEQGTFGIEALSNIKQVLRKMHIKLDGDIIGQLLIKTHDESGYNRYIGFWIPVKKNLI